MARQIQIIVPVQYTDEVIAAINGEDGLLSMALQKNSSLKPPGDILTLQITNSSLPLFMHKLEKFHLGKEGGISLSTSEPDSIITNKPDYQIENDSQDAIWEEVGMLISKESNMSVYVLLMMVMSGIVTTVGLATSTIHVVVGGMLIAPGFMPLMRITLGIVIKNKYWHRGVTDTLKGYGALMIGAIIATLILRLVDTDPLSPKEEYYQLHHTLIDYWSNVTPASILSTTAASIVGVLLLITKRTIFASGVMIALAIIPAASLIAISLLSANFELAMLAFIRFAVDFILIIFISYLLFSVQQYVIIQRSIKN